MEHSPTKVVQNTLLFTGTLVVQKAISFLYFWFLSAQLTPALLGTYIWALSIIGAFSIGIDLGLAPLLIREAARDPARSERLLRAVLGLKILFTIATLALLTVVLLLSRRDIITIIVVAVGGIVMILDSFTMSFYALLRARQQIRYESIGMLGFQILVFATGAYLLGIARSPIFAMTALALGSAANFIYAWSVVRFRFRVRTAPLWEQETANALLKSVPAFAASGIFVRLYNVADSILLGYLAGSTAVGLYSVPAKVVTAFQMLIPGAFVASIYPAMSYHYRTDRTMLERLFERSVGYLLILVLPITAGLLVLIPEIVRAIWPQYLAATNTFFVMVAGLPFLFLSFSTGYFLNATDRERKNTANRGIVTAINIVLNLILIPRLGVFGAGISFLVGTVVLFILDLRNVRQVIPFELAWLKRTGAKAALGSVVMGALLFALRTTVSLLPVVLIGVFVYGFVLLILRAVSKEELRMLRDIIRPQKVVELPPEV